MSISRRFKQVDVVIQFSVSIAEEVSLSTIVNRLEADLPSKLLEHARDNNMASSYPVITAMEKKP